MCAILFYHSLTKACDPHKFEQALDSLLHRGPDGKGIWFADNQKTALGHARLAINGDYAAAQPMHSDTYVIAVNGELYNQRAKIEKQGITFNSESDSEYLLHHFQLKGVAGLTDLDGEFAFAIYDKETDTAYLGRDRHGIKPLFYCFYHGQLIAASEIKALLKYGVEAKWNKAYLAGAEFFVQDAAQTFVEGVVSVPAGHILKISEKGIESFPYVDKSPLEPALFKEINLSFNQACSQFEELLVKAVDKRLVSHLSNQAYLSGGIDSSIISAIANGLTANLHAYTIAFTDSAFDESKLASEFAGKLGISHDIVEVNDTVLADNFYNAVRHCEMVVPNINVAAKFYLSKILKQSGCKTVLTGEGADESLLGYGFFRQDLTAPYTDIIRLPVPWHQHLTDVKKQLGFLPAQIVHTTPVGLLLSGLRNKKFSDVLHSFPDTQTDISVGFIADSQKLHYHSVFQTYNLGALADRTEMAHGIEGRPPFLDNELTAFVHSLPLSYKFDGIVDKRILREVATKFLPTRYAQMPKKPFISAPASLKKEGALALLFQSYFLNLKYLPEFYNKQKVGDLYLQALAVDPGKQASLDPALMHLCCVMILQQSFFLTM